MIAIDVPECQWACNLVTPSIYTINLRASDNVPSGFILLIASQILFCWRTIPLALKNPVILLYPVSGKSFKILFITASRSSSLIVLYTSLQLRPNSYNRLSTVWRLTQRILAMVGILNRCPIRSCSCSLGILNFGLPCTPVNIVLAVWELVDWLEVFVSFTSRRRSITLGSIPSVLAYLTRRLINQSRRNTI